MENTKYSIGQLLWYLWRDIPSYVYILIKLCSVNYWKRYRNLPAATKDVLLVLGNGPSIKDDMPQIIETSGDASIYCVNHFADSEYFEILKPDFYGFLDPYFWESNVGEEYERRRSESLRNLKEKTSWPLYVFIPDFAKIEVFNELANNENIRLIVYNYLHRNLQNEWIFLRLLRKSILMPKAINVVHHSVFNGMMMGFNRIDVYGIDASIYRSLETDPITNEVFNVHKHFYGINRTRIHFCGDTSRCLSMEECLGNETSIFKGYRVLASLSRLMRIETVNMCSNSMVDTMPRPIACSPLPELANYESTTT
tara:strand:- start:1614 stop:2546 length:933 start_codon:yes stop_codon:yes gene_type:complete